MLYVIDRFEDKWAVINHNRKIFNIPRDLFPDDAKEGDIITISIKVDKVATKHAQNETRKLMDSLFEEE